MYSLWHHISSPMAMGSNAIFHTFYCRFHMKAHQQIDRKQYYRIGWKHWNNKHDEKYSHKWYKIVVFNAVTSFTLSYNDYCCCRCCSRCCFGYNSKRNCNLFVCRTASLARNDNNYAIGNRNRNRNSNRNHDYTTTNRCVVVVVVFTWCAFSVSSVFLCIAMHRRQSL